MDLKDQLRNLFPEHVATDTEPLRTEETKGKQRDPILCKYEKRKGKPLTILEGYQGTESEGKKLAKELKTVLGVGGTFKNAVMIIQGDYRNKIMELLKDKGFTVKRVGG